MRQVVILGSTGSIGTQAIEVITERPERFEVVGLAAGGRSVDLLVEQARRLHPAWVIPGTPFTTATVNNTYAGAIHTDAGDLKAGFGVLVVLREGHYEGCETVFPEYGVGVDL